MTGIRDAIGWSYYPLRLKNQLNRYRPESKPRLRIISYHDMSQEDEGLFERQLLWIMRNWEIIPPSKFEAIAKREIPLENDSILLTFDDGTVSNLHVANRILKPLGIHALFFIVTDYALLNICDDWREFAARRILLREDAKSIPDNFRNMSIEDLQYLISEGHTIGAHTATHARLSDLTSESLNREIVEGADRLEQCLDSKIDHFAYPFGDFASISEEASKVARERFNFVYSGMRGDNGGALLSWHISRDSNDPKDSLLYTGACLEGGADFLYAKKLSICSGWGE